MEKLRELFSKKGPKIESIDTIQRGEGKDEGRIYLTTHHPETKTESGHVVTRDGDYTQTWEEAADEIQAKHGIKPTDLTPGQKIETIVIKKK